MQTALNTPSASRTVLSTNATGSARDTAGSPASNALAHYQIIRRNGAVVPFEPNKIAIAMMKAFLAVHGTQGAASASVRETVDGLTQAGGFVLNCNDGNDLDVEVFVNHGWESLQLYEPLSKEMTYRTFCQMFEKDHRKFQGDVIVFDESDKIVASYKGIVVSLDGLIF